MSDSTQKPVKQNDNLSQPNTNIFPAAPGTEDDSYKSGEVLKGTVTGITSFGAFIRLPNHKEGMVHISEIANTYVTDITQFLILNQEVEVLVLNKNDRGKYDLSIKQSPSYKLTQPAAPAYGERKDRGSSGGSFDDLLDNFLKKSEEIQLDVRRNLQYKQGVKKKGQKKQRPLGK